MGREIFMDLLGKFVLMDCDGSEVFGRMGTEMCMMELKIESQRK